MASNCPGCTTRPAPLPEIGTLYLAPPQPHTLEVVRGLLTSEGISHELAARQTLSVPLAPGRLARLAELLEGALSRPELEETRSLVVEEARSPCLDDLARMRPLSMLLDEVLHAWLPEMLSAGRLTTYFQPILRADRPGEVFAQECLMRGLDRDGAIVAPKRIYDAARDAGMLFQLDRDARLTAIRTAAGLKLDDRLFINFNPTTIYDPAFCLRSTFQAVRKAGIAPGRIVFEVVESDEIKDRVHLRRIADHYREAGFGIALDDLGSGYGSLTLLAELRPDYVKLDMELIRGIDRDPIKATIVGKLLELSRDLGVPTVAEGIETAEEWDWVRTHGADYVQGFYFARPVPIPERTCAARSADGPEARRRELSVSSAR